MPSIASKDQIRFERYTVNNGLNQNEVGRILQDRQGFMWFGTEDGLHMYDGIEFKIYNHKPFDSTSLASNTIYALYEDNKGALWIGTGAGLSRLDEEDKFKGRFYRYGSHHINSIYQAKSGKIWASTHSGLLRVSNANNKFDLYSRSEKDLVPFNDADLHGLLEDQFGVLWTGTGRGRLYRFDQIHNTFEISNLQSHGLDHGLQIQPIYEDLRGVLWIGTGKGLHALKPEERRQEKFTNYGGDRIQYICEDSRSTLWIGTASGLFTFDRTADRLVPYQPQFSRKSTLSKSFINQIYEDQSGTLWIGTQNEGLFRLRSENLGIDPLNYKHAPSDPFSLSYNTVISLFQDRSGTYWAGTVRGGLNKFDLGSPKFTHYIADENREANWRDGNIWSIYKSRTDTLWVGTHQGLAFIDSSAQRAGLRDFYKQERTGVPAIDQNQIRDIHEDRFGNLWLASLGNGLIRYSPHTQQAKEFKHDNTNPKSIGTDNVYRIYETRSGELWLGANYPGFIKFDRGKEEFVNYSHNPANPAQRISWVTTICEDDKQMLWIGSFEDGLIKFNPRTKRFMHYSHNPSDSTSLSSNSIFSIHQDRTNVLWIGTNGGGLSRLSKNENGLEQFSTITRKSGLSSNVIYGIVEDEDGNLWLSSTRGICKFNPLTGVIHNYDVADGLQGNEFNLGAYHKAENGEIFFGGTNGFSGFFPFSQSTTYSPTAVLTTFRLLGSENHQSISLAQRDEIRLAHFENSFEIGYTTIHYKNPSQNRSAYKLDGFDENWTRGSSRGVASYTNIDPGEYRLMVEVSSGDGPSNRNSTSIPITIANPWWDTWWAYGLYAFLIIGATIAAVRYRERSHRRQTEELEAAVSKRTTALEQEKKKTVEQAEKLKELDTLKSRFFANISHEFRTPLTLILGSVEQIIAVTEELKMERALGNIWRNAQRLLRLVNELLDLAKLESGSMALNNSPGDLVGLARSTLSAFSPLAVAQNIELRFGSRWQSLELYFDHSKIQKILSNLLSNALKFTAADGKVELTIEATQTNLQLEDESFSSKHTNQIEVEIRIADSGIGISERDRPHIFERFFRVSDNHKNRTASVGAGIGLALTKELVEFLGGSISAESKIGIGTTFSVRLPFVLQHTPAAQSDNLTIEPHTPSLGVSIKESEAENTDHPIEQLQAHIQESIISHEVSLHTQSEMYQIQPGGEDAQTILVVEDNPEMRRHLSDGLMRSYRVISSDNGADGFEVAAATIPDLIISDVMMPKKDGYELCEQIKGDERTCHIPVILLTAKASTESKVAGLETGADDYIIKPFSFDELHARVRNLILQRQLLCARFRQEIFVMPKEITVNSMDKQFLERAIAIVDEHMGDSTFGAETFSKKIGMSRSNLNRKLRALTDYSINEFVRSLRMKRAASLLRSKSANVSEIADEVGFNNPSYFAQRFYEEFGCTPTQYVSSASASDHTPPSS